MEWLSRETGQSYRLLSEAEWEYVARAGSETVYSWGNNIGSNRANCDGCGSQWDNDRTAPVGSFPANAFGVHDMHGNVYEIVEDCWHDNYVGAPTDGDAWLTAECYEHVIRGGSWFLYEPILRSSARWPHLTGWGRRNLGFRVARALTP